MASKKRQTIKLILGFSVLLIPLLSITPTTTFAEVLNIPEAAKSFSVTLPGRGMSMTEVLEKFGEPKTREPEVGEPPITRWQYEDYNVIFEYQYVIHALATNKPMGLMAPEESATKMETPASMSTPTAMPTQEAMPSESAPDHQAHH